MENIKQEFNITSESGFTLIEILMAMAILGVVLLPLSQAYVISWQTSMRASHLAEAQMLGRWKVDQIKAEDGYQASAHTGNFGDEWNDSTYDIYDYTVQTETFPGAHPDFVGETVRLWIEYPDPVSGNQRSIHCSDINDCDRADFVFVLSDKAPLD